MVVEEVKTYIECSMPLFQQVQDAVPSSVTLDGKIYDVCSNPDSGVRKAQRRGSEMHFFQNLLLWTQPAVGFPKRNRLPLANFFYDQHLEDAGAALENLAHAVYLEVCNPLTNLDISYHEARFVYLEPPVLALRMPGFVVTDRIGESRILIDGQPELRDLVSQVLGDMTLAQDTEGSFTYLSAAHPIYFHTRVIMVNNPKLARGMRDSYWAYDWPEIPVKELAGK